MPAISSEELVYIKVKTASSFQRISTTQFRTQYSTRISVFCCSIYRTSEVVCGGCGTRLLPCESARGHSGCRCRVAAAQAPKRDIIDAPGNGSCLHPAFPASRGEMHRGTLWPGFRSWGFVRLDAGVKHGKQHQRSTIPELLNSPPEPPFLCYFQPVTGIGLIEEYRAGLGASGPS